MATKDTPPPPSSQIKNPNEEEEDYIDMEVTSSSSCSSPQTSREFEFQMSSVSINDTTTTTVTTSPADELFYRGKLLPLHLPPRLEMVQKLLTSSKIESFQETKKLANTSTPFESFEEQEEEERFSISTNTRTPFDSCNLSSSEMVQKLVQTSSKIESFEYKNLISTHPCQILQKYTSFGESDTHPLTFSKSSSNIASTPFDQSCNISPSESCRVSCELNPDEYFFEWSTEFSTFFKDNNNNNNHPIKMKSWSKKLKLVKQSLISQKLKAYLNLKSLFNKSEVPNGTKDCSNKYIKVCKRTPFGHIGKCTSSQTLASVIRDNDEDNVNSHRRSFSAAIKKHSPTKCLSSSSSNASSSSSSSSSSSFSLNSNGFYELNLLKRSSSATTEIEGSIEAAIAHCKKSQEVICNPKRKLSESAGVHSLPISKFAATEIQERTDLCRF